jgi:hypothetical protein
MAQNVIQNVGGQPSADSSIALGQINVNATVTVSFELESQRGTHPIDKLARS